jgi:hypothetical protein
MKILIVGAVLASAAVVASQPKPPVRENSRWHVTASPVAAKDSDTKFVDALLFGSGTLASNVQGLRGLKAAAYNITPKEGKWVLAAKQTSPKVGEVTWSCEIAGDKISGTMVFQHKGGTVERFQLRGMRAPDMETTSWTIQVSDKAGPVDDTLLFVGHKMTSKAVRTRGFVMCAYNLVPEEDGWVLEAMQRNKKDKSKAVWSAKIEGNKIKGTITVFDADGETKSESTFEGSKSKKRVRVKKSKKSKRSKKAKKK